MAAHCDQCQHYEATVRSLREAGQDAPSDLVPCDDYAMSPEFREWVLAALRRDVMAQVAEAGLDRMAMVKAPPSNGHRGPGGAAASQEEDGEEE